MLVWVTNLIWGQHMYKSSYLMLSFLVLAACNNQQVPQNSTENSTNQSAILATEKAAKPNESLADTNGTFCFKNSLNQDITDIKLVISGANINGIMNWIPYQKDSARGTLTGTKNTNGELDLRYDYLIEGSQQSETKIMKIENEKLWIKKGELIDPKNDGHLIYKDLSQAKYGDAIDKSDCKNWVD